MLDHFILAKYLESLVKNEMDNTSNSSGLDSFSPGVAFYKDCPQKKN